MKLASTALALTMALGTAGLTIGCDDATSRTEETKVRSDGSAVKKTSETTVHDNGTVTKETTEKKTAPMP